MERTCTFTDNTIKEEGRNLEEVGKIHEQEETVNAFGRYFYSKLVYCLALFGNVSGPQNYMEVARMAELHLIILISCDLAFDSLHDIQGNGFNAKLELNYWDLSLFWFF